ncbi:hypothetical protein J7E91_19205 [Streptomyces sp. ISL-99]|uniref:hypothetical protein n=1 Tax=Streptomyces sp. ISL-99 TaxID=2819193 RepID=UPI001BEC77D0|nr:hypothetical protein [Streptomyces sp. ISL-99]MBT2527493.1 hypothetical protein [Streptomyces sp. ISL-99]
MLPFLSRKVPAGVEKGPVAGTIVPRWHQGATVEALAADCRRIVELVESGEGVSAKQITARLGLELGPASAVQGDASDRAGMADGVADGAVHAAAAHRDRSCSCGRGAGRARRRLVSMACEK